MVLNDPIFSKYLAINEFKTANRQGKREGSTVYIYFFGDSKKLDLTANLTVYKVLEENSNKWPIDQYYMTVKIKGDGVKSDEVLQNFISIFGKLLTLYYEKAPGYY